VCIIIIRFPRGEPFRREENTSAPANVQYFKDGNFPNRRSAAFTPHHFSPKAGQQSLSVAKRLPPGASANAQFKDDIPLPALSKLPSV
jgi:hypothetical protein